MPSSYLKNLSEEKEYKRYSDNVTVKAILVDIDGRRLMRISEKTSGNQKCPGCGVVLSVVTPFDDPPPTYLEVSDFHERHKPLDVR